MIAQRRRHRRALPALLPLLAVLFACADSPSDPGGRIVAGVDLDVLFAPPTPAEIAVVHADWQGRNVSSTGFREEQVAPLVIGVGSQATLRIVSHIVGGARHYGAIVVPDGAQARSLPVVVYAHGGDNGVRVEEFVTATFALGGQASRYAYVIPSFRSETVRFGAASWRSGGEPSPWDRDVDDALALLDEALANTPAADPARIGVLGSSRGGGVGLVMGVRDARIDGVIDIFGPTDFYGEYVQEIVEEALRGSVRDLPGMVVLNDRFIKPLREGTITMAEMRRQLLLRSPVYFAERLRGVQVHHGTADIVVDVSQGRRLIARLQELNRTAPAFEFYIYDGGTHDALSLPGAPQRVAAYLSRL
ncbi:MAG: alpha/beta hydrolase family protein [Longimicrobiales bacterium]